MDWLDLFAQDRNKVRNKEASETIEEALKRGLASEDEVASPGRKGLSLYDLLTTGAQSTGDGRIEGPFSPAVNLPGLPGEVAKDKVVEPLARKAVDLAQQQGIETVSSGYDQKRRMGWALGRDRDGKTVRVEAEPDTGLEEAPGWLGSTAHNAPPVGPVVAAPDEGDQPEWLRTAPDAPAPVPAPSPAVPAAPKSINEMTDVEFTAHLEQVRAQQIAQEERIKRITQEQDERIARGEPLLVDEWMQKEFFPAVTDIEQSSAGTIYHREETPSQKVVRESEERKKQETREFRTARDLAARIDGIKPGEADHMFRVKPADGVWKQGAPIDRRKVVEFLISKERLFDAALKDADFLTRLARFGTGIVQGATKLDPSKINTGDERTTILGVDLPTARETAFFEEVSARQKDKDGFWGRFLNDTVPNIIGAAPGMIGGAKLVGLPVTMGLSGAADASLASHGDLKEIAKGGIQGAIQGKVASLPVPGLGSNALTKGASIVAGEAATNVAGSIAAKVLTGDADKISGEGLAQDALLGGTMATRRLGEIVRTKTTGVPPTDPARVSEQPRAERLAAPPPDPILGDKAPAPEESLAAPDSIPKLKVSDVPTTAFKGTPTGSHEVINAVADILGAGPLRFGRTNPGEAGAYKPGPDVARVRSAADASAAIHEVGHRIWEQALPDITTAPTYKQMRAELIDLGKQLYPNARPRGGYAKEGWAEFFRKYVSESDTIAQDSPFLTQWFESVLGGETKAAVQKARDVTTQYRSQGKTNLVKSMLAPAEGKPSVLRRVADFLGIGESFARKWVEAGTPFKQLADFVEGETGQTLPSSRNPYKVFTYLNKLAGSRSQHFIEQGTQDFAGNVNGPSLDQVRAAARGAGTGQGLALSPFASAEVAGQKGRGRTAALDKLFSAYLYARHSIDVWGAEASGAKRLAPGGPGIDLETAEATVQALDSPRFQEAARLLREYSDNLMDYVVQSGALTTTQVQKMQELYPNHLPLHRVLNDFAQDAGLKGTGTGGSPIHSLRGSGRRVRDPFQQLVEQTEKWIDFAHKHKLAQSVAYLRNIPGVGHFVEEVRANQLPHEVQLGRLKSQLEGQGIDLTGADLDSVLMHFETDYGKSDTEGVLPINVGGRTRLFKLDPTMYEALSEVDVKRLHPVIDFMFGKPKRAFVLGTTGLNAGFSWFTNFMRDLPTALMQSRTTQTTNPGELLRASAELTAALGKSTVGGLKEVLGLEPGKAIDTAERLGVHRARMMGTDTNATKQAAQRLGRAGLDWEERWGNRLRHPIDSAGGLVDWMREVFQIPETAMRAAEVERVLAGKGRKPGDHLTLDDAIDVSIAGKQVTVDFSAAGKAARVWNELTPFFNAGVQGARSMARTFKENPKAAVLKGVLGITVPTLLLWWKNKDEEWWKEMPWSERFTHWHTGAGDEVIRVPKGQEWANVFANVPLAMAQSLYDEDPKGAEELIRHLSKTAPGPVGVPLGTVAGAMKGGEALEETGKRLVDLMPQTAQVSAEQALNLDLFRDAPLVSHAFDGMEAREQHDKYTTKFARWVADITNLSPKRIDHLVSGFFGSQPKEWMDLVGMGDNAGRDFEPADIPIVGRAFRRGGKEGTRSATVEEFYAEHERLSGRERSETAPLSEDERQRLAHLNTAKKQMALLREGWTDEPNRDKRAALQKKAREWARWALDGAPEGKQPEPLTR